ncbi:hypothetical protein, partial [Citrobacter freundii]|uniref:hypothetical protein n=1 Tax=Citrobacter freundii TaxID=546 RepID=UPI001C30E269
VQQYELLDFTCLSCGAMLDMVYQSAPLVVINSLPLLFSLNFLFRVRIFGFSLNHINKIGLCMCNSLFMR